jgi:hypothetical protein
MPDKRTQRSIKINFFRRNFCDFVVQWDHSGTRTAVLALSTILVTFGINLRPLI